MEHEELQKDINDAKLLFKVLSSYAPNLEIFSYIKEKITQSILKNITLNPELSLSEGELLITCEFLEIPFHICTNIHLFSNEPLKVMEYIKRKLKGYDPNLANVFLDVIRGMIVDTNRFQKQTPQLKYIIHELNALRIEDIQGGDIEFLTLDGIEFFKGVGMGMPIKPLLNSFCEVRGWVMTEQKQISEFVAKHETEILAELNKKWKNYPEFISTLSIETSIKRPIFSPQNYLANNDWDYYFNVGNSSDDIVNGFIIPTKEYFETGERAGFMDSLQFMNLLWEQIDFLESNRKKPYSTLKHYESLPITEEQRHVLFGFILKFYNGYPVIEINSRKGDGICLLLIEEAFLRYTGDTPEKKYCHNSKVLHGNTNSEYIILEELPQTYTYNAKDFEEISTKYDWDFYHNVDNIANQKGLVLPVRKYFQVGSRRGFIEPLAFLNLMWQQRIYIRTNESKPHSVITHLKLLSINDKVRHILYGMLLKFEVGGYPVAESSNTPNHNLIMKLIEKEFLNYPEDTPEKEFCKQHWLRENESKQMKAAVNNSEPSLVGLSSGLPELKISVKTEKSDIYKSIEERIAEVDREGWKYVFRTEEDFQRFTQLITRFFEGSEEKIHAGTISVQASCKTRFAPILRQIYKDHHKEGIKLKKNKNYLELIKVLKCFKSMTYDELYKAITR